MFRQKRQVMRLVRNPGWAAFIWFGMTAGISLLATPVRFGVSALTRPVALDVARAVFAALNKAEFVALILLLILVRTSGMARNLWAACGGLALILIAQSAWLLPLLSARTDQIIAGMEPASSPAHAIYSILELTKLGLLLFVGFRATAAALPVEPTAASGAR